MQKLKIKPNLVEGIRYDQTNASEIIDILKNAGHDAKEISYGTIWIHLFDEEYIMEVGDWLVKDVFDQLQFVSEYGFPYLYEEVANG